MNRKFGSMARFFGWLGLLFMIAGCMNLNFPGQIPDTDRGVLDLSGWDFSISGPIAPKGKWALYKNKLLANTDQKTRSAIPVDSYVNVPGSWSKFKDLKGESLPAFGYMTYHLKILNSNPLPGSSDLVLYLPHIRSASELYIQSGTGASRLASRNGQIGTSKETYRPWFGGLEGNIDSFGTTHIFVQVSNFDDAVVQGVHEHFYIGTRDQITKLKNSRRHWDFIMMGMIIFAAAFMLVFFLLRRSEMAPFWLGLFSLTFALRIYVLRLYAYEYFNDTNWFNFLFRANYFTVYFLCLTYIAFIRCIFRAQFSRRIAIAAYTTCLVFALLIQATAPSVYSAFFNPFIAFLFCCLIWIGYGQVRAFLDRQDSLSIMMLVGSCIMILAAGLEIVVSLSGGEFRNIMQFGFTLNILCMSIVVSVHNARERNRVERLTTELSQEVEIRLNAEKEISMLYQQVADRVVDTSVKLKTVEKELQKSEHKTEIADLTTGTLHNVKNVLTSLKTSSELLNESLNGQFVDGFRKAVEVLNQKMPFLIDSTKDDPKVKLLLEYFIKLDSLLEYETEYNKEHLLRILAKIKAIEEIITSQQRYGGVGRHEAINPILVLEDALNMQLGSMSKRQVRINKLIETVPFINVEKVKLLHVLINLIKNAIESMTETPENKRIVSIETHNKKRTVQIVVKDNGHGIAPEHLDQIFSRGFTTKKEGHGFGLNSSLKYINEMGGKIRCESEGIDMGATFILEFTKHGDQGEDNETTDQ